MIEQLLQRSFLRHRATKAIEILGGDGMESSLRAALGESDPSPDELRAALVELRRTLDKEEQEEALNPTSEAERCYLPRHADLALLQSALQEYYEVRQPEKIESRPPGQGARPEDVPVTDRKLVGVEMPKTSAELFEKFSNTDIGWATVLWATARRKVAGRHPFNPKPADPLRIANNARVIVFGDWGSGVPRAQQVASRIREVLDRGKQDGVEQHVIHLGDVYYSGWPREYRDHALKYWPVQLEDAGTISSWSTNSNHDMYAGGHGYFGTLLADTRFGHQQKSSFFSLHNDHWNLIGLDTGYDEHDLHGPQAQWVKHEVESNQRKNLLLSHHQLFDLDASGKSGKKLAAKLQPVLSAGRVDAWFWGHEHECTLFKPHLNVRAARCVGHAGVPVHVQTGALPSHVDYQYRDSFDVGFESWSLFGFAVLDFDGGQIKVRYINEKGQEHHAEVIV